MSDVVAEPMPLLPYPALLAQHRLDAEVVQRGPRPAVYEYDYSQPYERRRVRVASYPEWGVACPYRTCRAPVGEPCSGGRTMLHERRRAAYWDAVGGPPGVRIFWPDWRRRLSARMEQRRAVVALERAAYEQTRANDHLRALRDEAARLLVDPAMADRAVAQGHQRARRFLLRHDWRGAPHREQRLGQALRGLTL